MSNKGYIIQANFGGVCYITNASSFIEDPVEHSLYREEATIFEFYEEAVSYMKQHNLTNHTIVKE